MPEPQLIDAHCHLQDERLAHDLPAVFQRMEKKRIRCEVVNGTHPDDWLGVKALAENHPGHLIPSFGLHPWRVPEAPANWYDQLEEYLDAIPSAIGEIGLDRWKEPRDEGLQEDAFRKQLRLAREADLPCSIHCLHAWGWMMDILMEEDLPERGFLLHSYNGSAEQIKKLTELGAYFSVSGSVTEKRRKKQQEALLEIPLDRLLLETDAPDMLPAEEYRQVTGDEAQSLNEPANLGGILCYVAQERKLDSMELAQTCNENCRRFFSPLISFS